MICYGVVSLFIVMDPIGLIPLIVSLTSDLSREQRRRVVRSTIYTAALLLLAFSLAGIRYYNSLEYHLRVSA